MLKPVFVSKADREVRSLSSCPRLLIVFPRAPSACVRTWAEGFAAPADHQGEGEAPAGGRGRGCGCQCPKGGAQGGRLGQASHGAGSHFPPSAFPLSIPSSCPGCLTGSSGSFAALPLPSPGRNSRHRHRDHQEGGGSRAREACQGLLLPHFRTIPEDQRIGPKPRLLLAQEDHEINTDDDNDEEAEFEAWKQRELARIKRARDAKEKAEKEAAERERLKNMTEEERAAWELANPKVSPAPASPQCF